MRRSPGNLEIAVATISIHLGHRLVYARVLLRKWQWHNLPGRNRAGRMSRNGSPMTVAERPSRQRLFAAGDKRQRHAALSGLDYRSMLQLVPGLWPLFIRNCPGWGSSTAFPSYPGPGRRPGTFANADPVPLGRYFRKLRIVSSPYSG